MTDKIKTFVLGIVQTNTYIIKTNKNNAVIVDPADKGEQIVDYLKENNLSLKYILLTHGHFDHIGAVNYLVENTNTDVLLVIHEMEKEIILDPEKAISDTFSFVKVLPCSPDIYVKDGDIIALDDLEIKALYTPGHTIGSCCYLINNCLFSGDTLFLESIGRTDLYSGDYPTIIKSVKSLALLKENFLVFPGHGSTTSLDHERQHNNYIGNLSYDDYF